MKGNFTFLKKTIILQLFILFTFHVPLIFGAMDDYCVSPPFLAQSISPNILIVLDNSGSMCGEAYGGSYDPSQFDNSLYYGYFDGTKNYRYNGSRWEVTTSGMATGTVSNPIANGSFLNWATMRRTEIAKKLLIGGKADPRSPSAGQTVKLTAQTDCDRNFDKDFDTSAGDLIYPFVGNYNFRNDDGDLKITALTGASIYTSRPNSDITSPLPTGWSESPVSGAVIAYTKVDEAWSDGDSTYIENYNTTSPVIMGFNYTGAEPAGTITVKVHVRAKKTYYHKNRTRRIRGVLRINGTDYESSYDNLNTNYDHYSWTWTSNPKTNAAWTWDQIKQIATSDNLDGFGVKAYNDYDNQPYIRVTQAYLTAEVTTPNGGPFNIIVDQGMVKAQGLVDNLDSDVRFGLTYFNNNNAGYVDTYVGYGSPTNMITSIHNMTPGTWTPLGETLREMVGYYRQDSPYYNNSPADYSLATGSFGNANIFRDPYAYKFTDIDSSLTDAYVPCAKSFILFLTDGESTQDQSMPGNSTWSPYAACSATNLKACSGYGGAPNNPNPRFAGTPIGKTYSDNGTDYMVDVAYWARTNDMRPGTCATASTSSWSKCLPGNQNVFLYPIFMFGTGSSLLKDAAIYGGFVDTNNNGKPDCTTTPAECYKDSNGDGIVESNGDDLPITYYEGNDGYKLEQNIKQAIYDIVKRAASSTAVSVLSSSEGSGANLVQSLFYPKRSFSTSADITWTSDVMNYWYYFDPYFSNSQIREDTVREDSSYTLLDLKNDYITSFYFDSGQQKTMAARCQDTDGDGDCDSSIDIIPIEDAKALWRAGVNLWWTDPGDRTIMTSLNGTDLISFDTTNRDALDDYLGQTASSAAAEATINYVRGTDYDKLCSTTRIPCSTDTDCSGSGDNCVAARNRTAPLNICSNSYIPCSTDSDCSAGESCESQTHTWKLGDVVSSTPRIMGPSPLNNYNVASPSGYGDKTYSNFIKTDEYKDRQRVFVGSNDGMFHTFRLGKVLQSWTDKHWWEPGKLEGATGPGGIGTESWAFIPKNVLPYLQHLSDPDYCHIYMVDGPVILTDASINCPTNGKPDYWNCAKETTSYLSSSWRSIAIGSMGIGGATSSTANTSCVQTPINVGGNPVGWSSYFALDVTAQDNPDLLWEFSNSDLVGLTGSPSLGVTNVGPAIVKVGGEKQCTNDNSTCSVNSDCNSGGQCEATNGRWFAILASGSTGPIATDTNDFKGTSNQHLWLFVLDLKTGELLRSIDTGILNAFAGSISSNSIDLEKSNRTDDGNYQDDVVYIGYVKNTSSGGVLRLVINDDIDPDHWTTSTVIDGIGPVTTSVVNLLDKKSRKLWLYFAEGRYFYKQDDLTTRRNLFGIQEPCYVDDTSTTAVDYDVLPSCTSTTSLSNLNDQTLSINSLTTSQTGWYVTLDPSLTDIGAERVISNPTPDPLGAIYFLSFAPNSDICGYGGTTYLWALDYKSGGTVTYTMQGKALVQVSTGEIKELDLSDPATFTGYNNRRSAGFQGIPPTGQGLMIVTNPSPIKRFMHVQEQ